MNNAFYEERERTVLDTIQRNGRITVEEVCEELGISASTARLLLKKMHEKGLLIRTHGGAVRSDYAGSIQKSSTIKKDPLLEGIVNEDKKMQIAIAAAATVEDGDSIAISSGSTALLMASLITDRRNLTVVTDSVPVANMLLFRPGIRVLICGGQVRERNGACFGPTAEAFLQTLQVDKSYSGCDSVNLDFGITSMDIDPRTERCLIQCGKIRYILADSTKFNVKPFMEKTIDIEDVDYFITDAALNPIHVERLQTMDVGLLIGAPSSL